MGKMLNAVNPVCKHLICLPMLLNVKMFAWFDLLTVGHMSHGNVEIQGQTSETLRKNGQDAAHKVLCLGATQEETGLEVLRKNKCGRVSKVMLAPTTSLG